MTNNKVLDCLFGICVGDALGLPVEFEPREKRDKDPVKEIMRGYGTYNQKPGTWSDDSSLTFCLAESLCDGYDINDIGDKFQKWLYEGCWTAYGDTFDVGVTTQTAINNLKQGVSPLESGGTSHFENGNGSLMRISPIVFHVKDLPLEERFDIVKQVSAITHAHSQSVISCQIYNEILNNILNGDNIRTAYENMKPLVKEFYSNQERKLEPFERVLEQDISKIPRNNISSSGYVLHSLEASLWCNLNHNSYKDIVLEAVNLGWDTDTTTAIAGGIAGLYYGFENIPEEWVSQIARKEDIAVLAERLNNKE